ncbi:extracellular solute-binding protein [Halopiger aswanensis]|uniref:Carbohydrate ABC transporter substrate-binding protein (CUT1 family) n=1 Tax=Halopiger aswanensis TaxID=148449 RepID=A0A3R7ECQ9_9EURY|nr:carbohydrate ABC transporter substrate-binding protein (CUT1 family) [Halopiger aswanensis]
MPDSYSSPTGRTVRSSIRRRRFVKLTGATGLTASFAGCFGGSDDGASVLQLTATNEWQNNSDAIQEALYDAGLSEDIELEMISGGENTDEMQNQYSQWLNSNQEQPDLLAFDSGWTLPFIVREQILSLEGELSDDVIETVRSDYFEQSVNSVTSQDGELYGVPLYPDFPTIQYRKDLVEDAGYDWEQHATDPLSWEQFSHELADVYDQSDVDYGFNWQAASEIQLGCCVFNEFLTSWGGAYFGNPEENLYGPVGDRPVTVDEEPVLESLRMARTFIHGTDAPDTHDDFAGNITSEEAFQWGLSPSMSPFTDRNAVALRNWPYSININGADDALGEDMGVMPMPYGVPEGEGEYPGTGGSIGALGGWNYCVNPNTTQLEDCLEFLEVLTSEQFQRQNFELVGHIPPRPDVLENAGDVPIMGRYLDALSYAGDHTMARPVTEVWDQQVDPVAQEANAALMGDAGVEEAMSSLADRLSDIEAEYSGS